MKKAKTILLVTAGLRIGGAEKVARDIGLVANPEQYEVHYLVFGDTVGDYEDELTKHGCTVTHIVAPAGGYLRFMRTLRALLRQNRYAVVHAHTMFNIGLILLAAMQEGVPVRIAHAHSALTDGQTPIKLAYEAVMRRLILRCATDLIACGEAAGKRLYGARAYSRRCRLILNGIDTTQYRFSLEHREQVRNALQLQDSFVVGHAGHLNEIKNQQYLLHLMPELLKRKPNVKLLLLGEGEDRPMLEQLIRDMKLEECVIMTGNVRNVPDYLSAMDVFAFPSLYEGMPLSIVEVQANGLPCILSTSVPKDVYLTDLIQPVPLEQPHSWVNDICSAERKEPEKYSDMLKKSGFDTSTVMKKYYEIYERADQT